MRETGSAMEVLADADFFDEAGDVGGGDVVERVFVFLFEPFAQIFGSNVAGFAVGEVAADAGAEIDEARMGQAEDHAFTVDEELAIHGVTVTGGGAVPAVGETAAVDVVGDFRRDVEGADEITHRAYVGNPGDFGLSHSAPQASFRFPEASSYYFRAPAMAAWPLWR